MECICNIIGVCVDVIFSEYAFEHTFAFSLSVYYILLRILFYYIVCFSAFWRNKNDETMITFGTTIISR